MDELAEFLADSLLLETAEETIRNRLSRNHSGGYFARRFRSNAEGILQLGGLEGLQCWLDARMAAGIGTEDDMEGVTSIRKTIRHYVARTRSRLLKEHRRQQHREDYEALWLNLLARKDLNNRAAELKFNADPRQAILKRLQAAGVVA